MGGSTPGVEIALTGGIACGKSEVARIWREQGIEVLDTDDVSHQVMAPGGAAYDAVVAEFGNEIVGTDGSIDRQVLGDRVFADEAEREKLNGLMHPAIRTAWNAWRDQRSEAGEDAVVVIPLLFEVGAEKSWDAVVCVAASEETMLKRLRQRGLTDQQARQRLEAQWPIEEKKKRSDYVIENDSTLKQLQQEATKVWRQIKKQER